MATTAKDDFLAEAYLPGSQDLALPKQSLRRGSRVRIKPCSRHAEDGGLEGRVGAINGINKDARGAMRVAMTIEDEPGSDSGELRHPERPMFFPIDEIEVVDRQERSSASRVLVAGLRNVLLGDAGFGASVVQALASSGLCAGVDTEDFGDRITDLARALGDGYEAAIIIGAATRGELPGTIRIIRLHQEDLERVGRRNRQAMNHMAAVQVARRLGSLPSRLFVVECESDPCADESNETNAPTSPSVSASEAVGPAVELVAELAERLCSECRMGEHHD